MWWLAFCLGCASTAQAALRDPSPEPRTAKVLRVYVGTYATAKDRGIALFEMDPGSGRLTARGLAAESINPSFLAIHPSRRFLYAVNEVAEFGGRKAGAVTAFAIDGATGKLTLLNQQSSRGAGPCYVTVDRAGKNALIANYGGGSVAVLPIDADGRLRAASSFIQHAGSGIDHRRQEGPHAHSINLDSANRFAVAADLGLDKLLVYAFDPAQGTLTPNNPPSTSVEPGSGPRHFAFHPDARHAYVINEMRSTVTAFDYDPARGTLTTIQTISTLPGDYKDGSSTAEVQVHPSGKFLYGSNRGHDSIVAYAIDPKTGRLSLIGHQPTRGKTPRNFGIDPSGSFLLAANQDSGTVVVFRIDPRTGALQPTGQVVEVPSPVCVKFVAVAD